MSRVQLEGKANGSHLIVGLDPGLQQWFYQVWFSEDEECPRISSMDLPHPRGPSQSDMMDIIREHAQPSERRKLIIDYIGMDLDPATNPEVAATSTEF